MAHKAKSPPIEDEALQIATGGAIALCGLLESPQLIPMPEPEREAIARLEARAGQAGNPPGAQATARYRPRRGELTLAKWDHFDLTAKLWTIPVELIKSSHTKRTPQSHIVPLSPLALSLLKQLQALTGKGVYVLPARADQKKDRPYSATVLSQTVRFNEAHFALAHFTPHDLRRTAASFMTKIGVPRLHVEKVLNHSTGDIAEVYDRHDYLPEKRAALEKWATYLSTILATKDARNIAPSPAPEAATS
jgi:integrase